jgi:hypothetical protein
VAELLTIYLEVPPTSLRICRVEPPMQSSIQLWNSARLRRFLPVIVNDEVVSGDELVEAAINLKIVTIHVFREIGNAKYWRSVYTLAGSYHGVILPISLTPMAPSGHNHMGELLLDEPESSFDLDMPG